MNDPKQFAAILGFAFVAAWIGFNFGLALLCLLGAAGFYALAAVLQGEVDLGEVQARMRQSTGASGGGSPRRAG
jgi:UPF0716 family protein affecting phage T7 exclusion